MEDRKGLDRREFLRSLAAVGVGAGVSMSALSAFAQAEDGGDAEPFRLGIIGCGGQGNVLMANAHKVPGIRFVAACDIQENRAGSFAERAAEASGEECKSYTDYRKMLEEVEMDGVVIATPLFWHARIAIDAFSAGLHVFCEKCMAYTTQECKDMIMAQMGAGKILQIGHHLRYHPIYWHAKRTFVEAGLLGDITSVYAQWNRNGSWRRGVESEADFSEWGYETPDQLYNWRLYKELSGGLMTELASHQIDVVTWMLDKTPTAVQGVGGIDYYDDGRSVFDNVHVTFEYPGGVKFDYQSGTTNQFSMFGNQCHEIIKGTKGTLVLTHLNPDPAHSAGWFFMEPGAQKEIWMDLAHHEDVYGKDSIILDATVTEGPPLAGFRIGTLMDNQDQNGEKLESPLEYKLAKWTYELEFHEFMISCREGKVPSCDGIVGMKSATDAILANEAMWDQERKVFDEDIYSLT